MYDVRGHVYVLCKGACVCMVRGVYVCMGHMYV